MINFQNLFPKTSKTTLKNKHLQSSPQVYKLAQIDINSLTKSGIRGIILDLDNTIISEDDHYLSPLAENWLIQAKLAGLNFFILSNGKRIYRVKYWSERLNIPAISPAKKPFPKSFKQAMAKMQLEPKQVIVIGDSLHTDVVGAWLCGCSCIQVATLPHPPRWWEKLAGKWVQKPYPNHTELGKFTAHNEYNQFKIS
ncbi:YqeG family HAD IIIA-type phosphatase [Sphaerospermopsis aphanizomenoides BCCUSP55]|uniref:YqeG family HAD IIIA-type phosphatase n=1 Tax=Sphaerospermopsis aphanizomenoides TaxID=459663 RepID=UPI000B1D5B41|nr:YqeG family HAD IIIA-type phosphatase [Sphaerospermopsis aphanizomenoides]MBK1986961.1 YqeG family HAD IIIA-type phosphatase [Sphaerospermopsis aphanizomenoides BCCUSP55]